MIEPANPIVSKMLDRLFAAMVNGPSMNCRPHASRQRLDLSQLSRLKDADPGAALLTLIGPERGLKVAARVPVPARGVGSRKPNGAGDADPAEGDAQLTPEERAARQAWSEQQSLLTKFRVIADDARTYEQDTGVHALNIGFPLLSLPPGTFGGRAGLSTRRVLAPVAFIPAVLTVKTGTRPLVELRCHGDGVDMVVPNVALLAWLEQQTGHPIANPFEDEAAADPWREIAELVRLVSQQVGVPAPDLFSTNECPAELLLQSTPRSDEDGAGPSVITSAVLGLFPTSNQGLLKDTREMLAAGAPAGPIESFLRMEVSIEGAASLTPVASVAAPTDLPVLKRSFADERLVTLADPCQTQAVRLARHCRGLVVHGPPGTGKSQTIANVIGDHLARGERVLFVCDKRTALDVVADRLQSLGLGDLCATVHDPQRDQREFYRSAREQLDNLADTPLKREAAGKVAKIDAELQLLHDELSKYHRDLMASADGNAAGGPGSFHHLVGVWLGEQGDVGDTVDGRALQDVAAGEFERHKLRLREVLERGDAVAYAKNPWRSAAGIDLTRFLASPMDVYRRTLRDCVAAAQTVDSTADPLLPPFDELLVNLTGEAAHRAALAEKLERLASVPVAAARHWTSQPCAAVERTRSELAEAAAWVAEVRSGGGLDGTLLVASATAAPVAQLASEQHTLNAHAEAFEARVNAYWRVRSAAPDADDATVIKWMTAEGKASATARKRLEAAAPLAAAVDASNLDASMLARWHAAALGPEWIVESLAALNSYLDVAEKWTGAFQFAKKKAAEPVVRYFGLSLNAAAAAQVRQFLSDLQKRLDLRSAVEAATGRAFDELPDDGELLATFKQNRSVLASLAAGGSGAAAAVTGTLDAGRQASLPAPVVAGINQMLGSQAEAAPGLLARYRLQPDGAGALRLAGHLRSLEARTRVRELLARLTAQPALAADAPNEELVGPLEVVGEMLDLLAAAPKGTPVGDAIAKALAELDTLPPLVQALRRSPQRAAAACEFETVLTDSRMFSEGFLKATRKAILAGRLVSKVVASLEERLGTLEGVIRVRDGMTHLPAELARAAAALLNAGPPAAAGYSAVRRNVVAGEIARHLRASPELQRVDGHRLRTAFERFRHLSQAKKELVRDAIQDRWVSRQRERLLASTGGRLNKVGADLRRRLTMRGERAMRLRQVIAHGSGLDGGDPLFELRPVWMASPETVAQLFPREAIFDVVVFDEASQCRLEEAMPVLTRAKRVVIAGDPKQLPPTRFFESAVTVSEEPEAESDQELFESHQGEVEDLLTAALGLDVHQCYLDVHYRSRNADLIGFSNEHFYSSRLQAIPGHPRGRCRFAPLTLYRAEGVYEKRRNPAEADAVCRIVRDLLKRAAPPSIGIACFNLVQRDLIVEKLEEMADADPEFAARLAAARERRGPNSTEGLFVKNLENVQGDERDHIIISTTYGPDPAGKFRRSFGPLGSAGGGRRLNVLVTRARDELHIVTSIPKSAYGSVPDVPSGQSPSGAWLLFAYLRYAEQLQQEYEDNHRILEAAGPAEHAAVNPRPSRTPSAFSKALASRIAATHQYGSDVHWGNEGFCVDLALHHPRRAEDVTIGVLCDMTRFGGSEDPVEWDVFRTAVHEAQGWQLHRIWTPHFFRDPTGSMTDIVAAIDAALASGSERSEQV